MLNNNNYNPFFNTGYEDLIRLQAQTAEKVEQQPKKLVKQNTKPSKKRTIIKKGGRKS